MRSSPLAWFLQREKTEDKNIIQLKINNKKIIDKNKKLYNAKK